MASNNPSNNPPTTNNPYTTNHLNLLNLLSANSNQVSNANPDLLLQPGHSLYNPGLPVPSYPFFQAQESSSPFPPLARPEAERSSSEAKPPTQNNGHPPIPKANDSVQPVNEQQFIERQEIGMLEELKQRAESLASKGDIANSILQYQQLLNMDPDNGVLWTSLGHCHLLDENFQGAYNAYQKALNLLPDVKDPQLWFGIGLLYEKV